MSIHLTFLGAAGTVTGSKYLLKIDNKKILIDCGLFQGHKELRQRNWSQLPVSPREIDAVILTHAHIDHSGYLPLLVKNGFKGRIYATPATKDLCAILLPDSGYLQEEDAKHANKYGYSKHMPALPLYTKEDAIASLEQFYSVGYGIPHTLFEDTSFIYNRVGHILGAASVTLRHGNTSIVFTGDLGRPHDPIMRPPVEIQSADYLVAESTYGDRIHEPQDPQEQIEKIINKTIKRGGSILIPAFAVGRAQAILYYIYQLKRTGKIPDLPVFLDSPMSISATQLLCKYSKEHQLPPHLCEQVAAIATCTDTQEESKTIDEYPAPIIIISASGMATGGRILHHLERMLPDSRNTILLTGFQAEGTRGARLARGEKEIKIHGELVPVHAQIAILNNASAHADSQEMLGWLSHFTRTPIKTFIIHGEPNAALGLKKQIEDTLGWTCVIPKYLQEEIL